ncbi:MAG: Gfo/Idh/MocA family oxidoreductase [Planctomycetota bacterium]|nr:MAG: Gfo/Idh/MocA family oxidoreductase [Planctomycetota bacterium]
MIRVGIIGCGKITERASLPNLVNYKFKCKITCLCDIIKSRPESLANRFNLGEIDVIKDWRNLVRHNDVDAVFINTPNYLHECMAVEAAANRKHILVEKPIAISLKAANNMVKAAKRSGVLLMVEQTQRFDPVHQAADISPEADSRRSLRSHSRRACRQGGRCAHRLCCHR